MFSPVDVFLLADRSPAASSGADVEDEMIRGRALLRAGWGAHGAPQAIRFESAFGIMLAGVTDV